MAGHICGHVTGPGPAVLNDLNDVDTVTTPPTAGSFLVYNGTTWVVGDLGSVDNHTDVDTTTTPPTVGQVLKWDGSNWVPSPDAGAGILDTDDLPEGTLNLYYTDTRVQNAVDEYLCTKFDANCTATEQIGHAVYVSGETLGVSEVRKVDITDPTTMPAVGVIVSKPTSTTCTVLTFGCQLKSALSITGSAGDKLWVGTSGFLTKNIPVPVSGTYVVQLVGYMRTNVDVVIRPDHIPIKLVR